MTTTSKSSQRARRQVLVELPEDYEGDATAAAAAVNLLLRNGGLRAKVSAWGPFAPALEPMAAISTLHLSPETMDRLAGDRGYEGLVHCPTPGEGAFLVVDQHPRDAGFFERDWPADLRALLDEAREAGLQWLKLDPGAMVLEGLRRYEWPDPGELQRPRTREGQ